MSLTPVDVENHISLEKRWNVDKEAPKPTHNAGLYSGEAFKGPWGNIPVVPTTTNLIHHNLKSANPPPGATTQYPGTNRSGNNYIAMPGVYWHTSKDKCSYKVKRTEDTSNVEYKWCAYSQNAKHYAWINNENN
tara:strand:+ start:455 stop:856 length:402 start_codon:yes stop_codon:yes gene_type:complete